MGLLKVNIYLILFKWKVEKCSEKVLRVCIDYRLGPSILETTKLN